MTCATLPAPAHELLGLLTSTAKRRKHALVVLTSVADWAAVLGWEPSDARLWRDDLIDWGYLHHAEGRLVLSVACSCHLLTAQELTSPETDLSIPEGSSEEASSSEQGDIEGGRSPHLGEGRRAYSDTDFVGQVEVSDSWFEGREKPRKTTRLDRPVESWSNFDLGCYWNKALGEAATGRTKKLPLGSFPRPAILAGAFGSWRKERSDITPATIKAMVDRFLGKLEQQPTHQSLWKTFIGQRAALLDAVEQHAKRDLSRDYDAVQAEFEAWLAQPNR